MVIITGIKVTYMDLLRFLKENGKSRKIFGQRELKIIEKQLLGISLTQSEKNRLSRDIRQKFAFIKEAGRFEPEFALKKGAEIQKRIEEVKQAVLEDQLSKHVARIILFGSAAENKLTFRSDIDMAVVFTQITITEATLFRKRVLGKSPSRADVQVYNILPKKIQQEINKKGKVLYESPPNYGESKRS